MGWDSQSLGLVNMPRLRYRGFEYRLQRDVIFFSSDAFSVFKDFLSKSELVGKDIYCTATTFVRLYSKHIVEIIYNPRLYI